MAEHLRHRKHVIRLKAPEADSCQIFTAIEHFAHVSDEVRLKPSQIHGRYVVAFVEHVLAARDQILDHELHFVLSAHRKLVEFSEGNLNPVDEHFGVAPVQLVVGLGPVVRLVVAEKVDGLV